MDTQAYIIGFLIGVVCILIFVWAYKISKWVIKVSYLVNYQYKADNDRHKEFAQKTSKKLQELEGAINELNQSDADDAQQTRK